jgi:hypothetical protein
METIMNMELQTPAGLSCSLAPSNRLCMHVSITLLDHSQSVSVL